MKFPVWRNIPERGGEGRYVRASRRELFDDWRWTIEWVYDERNTISPYHKNMAAARVRKNIERRLAALRGRRLPLHCECAVVVRYDEKTNQEVVQPCCNAPLDGMNRCGTHAPPPHLREPARIHVFEWTRWTWANRLAEYQAVLSERGE